MNYKRAAGGVVGKEISDTAVILVPVYEPYEARNGNKLLWAFVVFVAGVVVQLLFIGFCGYNKSEHNRLILKQKPEEDDLRDMLNYIVPKGDHFITSIIININIVIFLLMIFSGVHLLSPTGAEVLKWGGMRRWEVTHGEWWRLITSVFVHGGIMHLVLNIVGLVLAATFAEPLMGRKNYAILYVLSGLGASFVSIYWKGSISCGASGAIFGIYGAILALLLTKAIPKVEKRWMFRFFGIYAGVNLVFGLLSKSTDNAAHIGGLLTGAMLAMIYYFIWKEDFENNEVLQED